MDIKKAYDSINWNFLEEMMYALKFPQKLIQLVIVCVRTPSFSLAINGGVEGFFQGRKGLRQGDPMLPLLFVICMDYLSRILKQIGENRKFKFHHKCKSLKLNHLVFADDLILFCKGDKDSI